MSIRRSIKAPSNGQTLKKKKRCTQMFWLCKDKPLANSQMATGQNRLWGQVECLWHMFLLEQWNFQDQLQTQALSDRNWPSLFHKPADRLPRDHCRVRQECGDGEARMSPAPQVCLFNIEVIWSWRQLQSTYAGNLHLPSLSCLKVGYKWPS